MSEAIVIGFPILITAAIILIIASEGILRWIARGEPDVNGDPEQDSTSNQFAEQNITKK